MQPKTLLELANAPLTAAQWGRASLVIIDAQRVYLDGALPLTGIAKALGEAEAVLAQARAAGAPVFHIVHQGRPGSPFAPDSPQAAIIDSLRPQNGEAVIAKTFANAFAGTALAEALAHQRDAGRPELVVVGFMTHNCVTSTVRGAVELGYRCTVVANACATRPLPDPSHPGQVISAEALHVASLAGLNDAHGPVIASAQDLADAQAKDA